MTSIHLPATGCERDFDSLAGLTPSKPARLLFWKGHLARAIFEFDRLALSQAAALRVAFIDVYGKPVTTRTAHFRKDMWRIGKQRLDLEWTGGLPMDVGVYLTDEPAWAEYSRIQEHARKAVNALDKERRGKDLVR